MITKATFNSEIFIYFIQNVLTNVPEKSIFVFDNVTIYKSDNVLKYFAENNLLAQTITVYSPWMNPVEKLIVSKKKQKIFKRIEANFIDDVQVNHSKN